VTERDDPHLIEELTKVRAQLAALLQADAALQKSDGALRRSADHFREALKNSPIVLFTQDADLRYTWIHNPFAGRSVADVLGKTDAELFPPDQADRLTEIKRSVLESGVGRRAEVGLLHEGGPRFYDLTVGPMHDQTGAPIGIHGVAIGITGSAVDVTDSSQAAEAMRIDRDDLQDTVTQQTIELAAASDELRQQADEARGTDLQLMASEERFRTILECSSDCIVVVDKDFRLVYVNRAAAEYVGKSPDEMTGKVLEAALADAPEFAAHAREQIARAFATGRPTREEGEVQLRGKCVSWETAFSPMADARAEAFAVGVVYRDVTERKRAEKATVDAYAELRAIFDGTTDGMWVVDLDHNVLRMNDALLTMLGLKEEPVGRKCHDVWPATICDSANCAVTRIAGGAERWESELEKALPDGTKASFIVKAAPYRSADGRLLGMIESFVDVTAHKQAEKALRQAVKMESVGRLAGGIAHDFNNLLTGISGYATLALKQMQESSQPYKDVTHIGELADRAANLVRQLLTFSRHQRIVPRVLDLNALVANLMNMLPRIIGEDVALEFIPAEDLAAVRADAGQIEQVLMNLAVNARDAMPQGGRLTFETANVVLSGRYAATHGEVTPGPYAMVAVSDTGCGMDRETLAHAFEPFFTTKEVGKGTGLGLPTAYGIVEQHGGCIWAYSELGQGTTVKVYLPSVEADGAAGKLKEAPATERPGTERVLLVEDEDAVRAVAQRALEQMGYTVVAASCPEEAEALFARMEGRIDVLLTDVVMPGCNGTELYRRLARQAPQLKVVYMSGYADSRISGDEFEGKGIRFIQKPFDPRDLTRQVRELLDG
jgi:PAS domain S-box-containing protein